MEKVEVGKSFIEMGAGWERTAVGKLQVLL